MLTEERIQEIYQEIRKEYLFPPTALTIDNGSDDHSAFCIQNRRIYMNITEIHDEIECRHIIRHEIGHTEYAPITIRNHRDYIADTVKNHKLPLDIAADLHNVTYDLIVDFNTQFKHDNDIGHAVGLIINDKKHKKAEEDKIFQYMAVFYASIAGDSSMFGEYDKDIRDRVAKAIKSCRNSIPLRDKVAELNKIIVDWFKQQNENRKKMLEALREALKKAAKEMSKNGGKFSTKEDIRGTKKESIMELAGDSKDTRVGKAATILVAAGEKIILREIDFYRAYAKRNIRFTIKSQTLFGPRVPAGYTVWTPDDAVSALNVEQGIMMSGMNIPGITTQKSLTLPGHYSVSPDNSDISLILVVDTSASMSKDDTVLVSFSFIESARQHNYPVGIVFFHTEPYLVIPPNREYNKTEEKIWKNYEDGSTCIIPALRRAQKMGTNNLVIVVSDFEGEGEERVNAVLGELSRNNTTRAVVLFNGVVPSTVPSINVPNIEQLSGVIISEVDIFTSQRM